MAPPKSTAPQLHPPPPPAPANSNPHTVPSSAAAAAAALYRRRPRRNNDRNLLSRSVGVGIDKGVGDTIGVKGAREQRDTELLQIVNLLTLAHHRNKNQHRRSRWWKELGMLRRNLRRALVLALPVPVPVPVPVHHHGRREKQQEEEEEDIDVESVIGFVRATLIPRCWVAFSDLVADAQYAGLGLMLLGTLARLVRVVGLREEEEEEELELELEVGVQGLGGERMWEGYRAVGAVDDVVVGDEKDEDEMVLRQSGGIGRLGEDLGVLLAREEEVLRVEKEDIQMTEPEKHAVGVEIVAVPPAEIKSTAKKRKEKKKPRDAIDELFSGLI